MQKSEKWCDKEQHNRYIWNAISKTCQISRIYKSKRYDNDETNMRWARNRDQRPPWWSPQNDQNVEQLPTRRVRIESNTLMCDTSWRRVPGGLWFLRQNKKSEVPKCPTNSPSLFPLSSRSLGYCNRKTCHLSDLISTFWTCRVQNITSVSVSVFLVSSLPVFHRCSSSTCSMPHLMKTRNTWHTRPHWPHRHHDIMMPHYGALGCKSHELGHQLSLHCIATSKEKVSKIALHTCLVSGSPLLMLGASLILDHTSWAKAGTSTSGTSFTFGSSSKS